MLFWKDLTDSARRLGSLIYRWASLALSDLGSKVAQLIKLAPVFSFSFENVHSPLLLLLSVVGESKTDPWSARR